MSELSLKDQGSIAPIQSKLKIGSLCTGYGGLDLAVEAYFNAETIWCAEFDKYASQVVQERFGIPNHGNIKEIDWATLPEIDVLTAGYPCQPFSHAGQRKGTDDPRHIYPFIKEAVSILRPRVVILENVRGHLSLGFKEVLGDLAKNGYDARWQIVRASDVGAPHQRARLFIIAYPSSKGLQRPRHSPNDPTNGFITDTDSYARAQPRRATSCLSATSVGLQRGQDKRQTRCECGSCSEIASDTNNTRRIGLMQRSSQRFNSSDEMCVQDIPPTLVEGKLNAKFVEYMMGLPSGWVTDLDLSRSQQLKMLGNGVVPQQAYYALELLHE